jgi:FixJ family two-component response regulator
VQIHRGRIMRKMAASSFADLVRVCSLIGIP